MYHFRFSPLIGLYCMIRNTGKDPKWKLIFCSESILGIVFYFFSATLTGRDYVLLSNYSLYSISLMLFFITAQLVDTLSSTARVNIDKSKKKALLFKVTSNAFPCIEKLSILGNFARHILYMLRYIVNLKDGALVRTYVNNRCHF